MNGKSKPEAVSFLLFLDVSFPVKLCGVPFPGLFDAGISEELPGPSLSGIFSHLSPRKEECHTDLAMCSAQGRSSSVAGTAGPC